MFTDEPGVDRSTNRRMQPVLRRSRSTVDSAVPGSCERPCKLGVFAYLASRTDPAAIEVDEPVTGLLPHR
ncbi:hypothetical protein EF294_06210 [Gordonia oryzae]|uniref:Uncharacterized protein n=1 Tax=Gordonia oryzae TaxID=2487349 RepID=A0A3N4GP91_9ACTN|nr:hypothetical protein EF294_06210 [Gordonia oryzae]